MHKKLYKLSSKIITTNYDTAFEKAVPTLRKNKAYKGKNYELTKHKEPGAPLLFKLHGCFEDIDSMVLFPTDYHNLYKNTNRDAEHSILVLKNIIMNKSILFVGAGMGDFQINNLFEEVRKLQGEYNQKHYIITKTPLDSALQFLTPIVVSDYSEISEVIDHLIAVKEASNNKDSDDVRSMKEQLQKAKSRIAELEAEINPNQARLLEREALKYFSKGVAFSLSNSYENAIKEYETATELNPDLHEAYNNWGNALANLAQTKTGGEAESLVKQAFDKYHKAIVAKADKHEAYNNWGTALANLAQTKTGEEAESLFNQAFDKYCKAIEIKPDLHQSYNNWGNALANLAQTKTGGEAEFLFNQAFEKYQKAIEIKPDKHEAYNNWGTDLSNLAQAKDGKEAEFLFNQAFDIYYKAIENGGSSYNLACLYAIRSEKKQAFELLKTSLEKNEITSDFVLNDVDWKNYYEDEDFKKIVEQYKAVQ